MSKQQRIKQFAADTTVELVASLLCAIGLYNFAVSSNFPISGVSGITTILYYLFDLPIGVMTIVINIPIALFCYKRLGKGFFWRSVRCIIIFSVMTDYVAPLLPIYNGDRMLSAICSAAIGGVGYAMIYMRGSSTGGTDFITISIKAAPAAGQNLLRHRFADRAGRRVHLPRRGRHHLRPAHQLCHRPGRR